MADRAPLSQRLFDAADHILRGGATIFSDQVHGLLIEAAEAFEKERDVADTETDQVETPAAPTLPDGEYAIVEMMGHRTMVGRVSEVERFGTKMLQLEPIFRDQLLPGCLTTGASVYQLTPCSKEVALNRQPKNDYSLPAPVLAALPPALLPSPDERPAFVHTSAVVELCGACGEVDCDCEIPF